MSENRASDISKEEKSNKKQWKFACFSSFFVCFVNDASLIRVKVYENRYGPFVISIHCGCDLILQWLAAGKIDNEPKKRRKNGQRDNPIIEERYTRSLSSDFLLAEMFIVQ